VGVFLGFFFLLVLVSLNAGYLFGVLLATLILVRISPSIFLQVGIDSQNVLLPVFCIALLPAASLTFSGFAFFFTAL